MIRTPINAYEERDALVALLARCYRSHTAPAIDPERGWDWTVCIHTPAGQMAWHFPNWELPMFVGLPNTYVDWDGHTGKIKYQRLHKLLEMEDQLQ